MKKFVLSNVMFLGLVASSMACVGTEEDPNDSSRTTTTQAPDEPDEASKPKSSACIPEYGTICWVGCNDSLFPAL